MVLRRVIAALLLTTVGACGGDSESDPPEPADPSDVWEAVEPAEADKYQAALEAARVEQDLPGLAGAIAHRDSRQLWVGATGLSNLTTPTAWLPTDESRIGSVTKTFTAAVIMQLSEEGLSLDDPIEAWVPGWYAGPTLRHLLSHTSGIVSYNGVGSFDKSRAWTPEELVQWAYDNEPNLRFTPGTQYEYSNTNFVLLGMVIEKVTAQSYSDAVRTRLFEPLTLAMRVAASGDDSPTMVRAYTCPTHTDASFVEDPSSGWAAGAIACTPTDLSRWIVALYGGELLSDASLAAMKTPSGVTSPGNEPYGLGTIIESDGDLTLVGHSGGIGGYQTFAYYLEPHNTAVILMSNCVPTNLDSASAHLLAAVLDIPYP
jgi:D-alanyl-D-alanine carboxypeptidase